MRKSVLTGLMAIAALSVYADEPTYNFFDPADCDEEGWLWLDTPEKIAKYVGADKKIQLINSSLEIEDPEFPGEYLTPETIADANVKGYNGEGVEGGEGSKTGGIILPQADGHGFFGSPGGGFMVQMPDCAQFDVYMSQKLPDIFTWIAGGEGYIDPNPIGNYIWNDDEVSWDEENGVIGALPTKYVAYDMNIQDLEYDANFDGTYMRTIYGPKGEPRTGALYNFSLCPMLIQGLRIKTFTDVSLAETSVEGVAADAEITINGKVVSLSAPAEISVYTPAGAKVAGVYGTSLDCSALNGLYIVKAGNKAVKVNL